MEKPFSLQNVVLYAKNWYETTDDMWGDLVKMLHRDGHSCAKTKHDVYTIITTEYSNWNDWLSKIGHHGHKNIENFLYCISQEMKYAYYGDELLDYKTAVVKGILHIFRWSTIDVMHITPMDFNREYRPGHNHEWYKPGCTYKYANDRGKRWFGEIEYKKIG